MTQRDANQEVYDREAEFRHEERHLRAVVDGIDRDIQNQEKLIKRPLIGPDVRSADVVASHARGALEKIKSARNNPFFGRLDYSEDGSENVRTVYIGRHLVNIEDVPNGLVINYNAPIAELYYNPSGFYEAPRGKQSASVYLSRTLTVEEAQLLDFEDRLRLPTPRMLTERLSGASSGQLTDAIETLQPEQYEALSKIDKPTLIVQGAAGTGKSLVALQRIAFMLSPRSRFGILGRNPTSERVIMFGPSPVFLQYVSGLLPELNVQDVRQQTITQWMLNKFSARVTLKGGGERILGDLMNNRRRFSQSEIEAHLFKGDLKMKRLLDRYVGELTRNTLRNARRQAGSVINRLELGISVADFRNRIDNAISINPELNAARQSLIDGLAELRARTVPVPPRRRDSPRSDIVATSRREVARELEHLWPDYDFRRAYVRLMSNPNSLELYSNGLDWELANAICMTVPWNATGRSLGLTDLASALYLDYKLNGFSSENFEHVVVDEAQDVSPMEIELLRMNSMNDSFTILGDLKQGLLPHRSITNWNQFGRLFERGNTERFEMRRTYRNTKQVTQYANRMLDDLPKRTTKRPQPYGRNGERPELARSRSAAEMHTAIADAIDRLRELDDVRSIGVLTKWENTAKDIMKAFRSEKIEDVSRLEEGGLIETDIIISPIILTKGLEFDAVIVANAGKNNFNETEFDRMLLYLACTRARHHLEIHWHGARSPIVPGTERLAR